MKIFVIHSLKSLAIQALCLLTFAGGLQATPIEPVPADKSKVPYKFAGKLFRVKDDFKLQGECSAQYVGTGDVVLTAAHCVSDGNSVLSPEMFVYLHAYTASTPLQATKAEQTVKCLAKPDAYQFRNPKYDYAFLKMGAPGSYGYFKMGSGSKKETTTSIGYPSNFNGGKELMAVHGEREAYTDPLHGKIQIMRRNPFGHVSSGGAWINSAREVVGLNAKFIGTPKGPDDTDNLLLSPIFDDTFKKLFDYVNGGCAGVNP